MCRLIVLTIDSNISKQITQSKISFLKLQNIVFWSFWRTKRICSISITKKKSMNLEISLEASVLITYRLILRFFINSFVIVDDVTKAIVNLNLPSTISNFSDKPDKPTLTVSDNDINNGGSTILKCKSTTASVTHYKFKKDGTEFATVVASSTSDSTYGINPASIDENADYACCALEDGVDSETSDPETLIGNLICFWMILFVIATVMCKVYCS